MTYDFGPNNPGLGGLVELTEDEELFIQNLFSLSYTEGDILFQNNANLTRLPIGTAGQVLAVNSGATAPEWSTSGGSNAFGTISVSGQSDVVADTFGDTFTLVAGTNITITTDAGTDTVTVDASGTGIAESLAIAYAIAL